MKATSIQTEARHAVASAKRQRRQLTRRIAVTPEVEQKLEQLFRCTGRLVCGALTFERDSELARKIRVAAAEMGGTDVTTWPTFATLHDADGYMRQYFPNGAMLQLNKATGEGEAYLHGECRRKWEGVKVADVAAIQAEIQSWAV